MRGNRDSSIFEKVDKRLIQKTQTLGSSELSAIVYSSGENMDDFSTHLEALGAVIRYSLPFMDACAVEIPSHELESMAKSERIRYISDDVNISTLLNIATQGVGATVVNQSGYRGKGIGIAVLDTGIYPHPDLIMPRSRIAAFKDFVNNKRSAYDDNGHGTCVAGAAAGNGYSSNGKYQGVAPLADIIAIKVMNGRGQGSSSDILAGMQWVVDNRDRFNIKVMSLSLGSEKVAGGFADPLAVAVERVWDRGVTVVAAAGNAGPRSSTITTPGVSPKIITVGAVDDKRTVEIEDDIIAKFSSRGPVGRYGEKPDVVAPGVDITTLNTDKDYISGTRPTNLKEQYKKMTGTSIATPIVAGGAALLLEKRPSLSPDDIKRIMKENARDLAENIYDQGKGLVNIGALLNI
ncbi:MAG: S8 family peptidase [Clostridiales bacterium]|nr:S8 family peptidase [Clostridiales bacterium]